MLLKPNNQTHQGKLMLDLYPTPEKSMTKKWFQSKTIWVNIIAGTGVLLGWLSGSFDQNPDMLAIFAGVQASLNILLRKITTQPLGK